MVVCVCVCVCVCVHAQALQQQPPPDCRTGVLSIFRLGLSPPVVAPGPMRLLISAAIVMKACSTFVAFLALVSRKGIAKESANSFKVKRYQSEAFVCFLPNLMYKCQKALSAAGLDNKECPMARGQREGCSGQ